MKISSVRNIPRYLLLAGFFFVTSVAHAQDLIVEDLNGDDTISILAFGDSLTFGIGDGTLPGEFVEEAPRSGGTGGYPKRVSTISGLMIANAGIPGEQFVEDGVNRLAGLMRTSTSDFVCILEGTNDTIYRVSTSEYSRLMQKAINTVRASGKEALLMTLPTPCCLHEGREPFTEAYTAAVRTLAALNDLAIADLERAWRTTCTNPLACELYNLPEGLHPNSVGYDVMSQTVLAALFGIDIFAEGGAKIVEDTFGLPEGTVIVKPGL